MRRDQLANELYIGSADHPPPITGQYVQKAAEAYFAATAGGTDLDKCIAISPTWEENHRFTSTVREGLKQRKLLREGSVLSVHEPLDWTEEQKSNAANYRTGMLITFNARIGSIARGCTLKVERVESGQLWLEGSGQSIDVARQSRKLTVSLPRTMEICEGEKILIRCNRRKAGLVNGQVLTVNRVLVDGALETREGKLIPPDFRHFCHGYVVTSHRAQSRTHDHVVIAAEQLDAKAAYVACSRGRHEVRIFTPEKAHLLNKVMRPSDRLAVADVIGASREAFWRHENAPVLRRTDADTRSVGSHTSHVRAPEMEIGL